MAPIESTMVIRHAESYEDVDPNIKSILDDTEIELTENGIKDAKDLAERFRKEFANFDKITGAAFTAAQQTLINQKHTPDFALLISCVGRKLILGSQIVEEVTAVNNTFENKTMVAGFYSYGEISPFTPSAKCELHNQTMTITTFREDDDEKVS